MNRRIIIALAFLAAAVCARPVAAQDALVVDSTLAKRGRILFTAKACTGCHTIGKGDLAGPDLNGLMKRRSTSWVKQWLRDPAAMLEKDDTARELLRRYNNMPMPNLKLSEKEIDALMHYIANESRARPPGGSEK